MLLISLDETILWMYQELDEAMGVEAFREFTEKLKPFMQ